MKRQVALWIQLIVFTLLLVASGALWFGREHVGSVFAALTDSANNTKGTSRDNRRGRKIPVVVARVTETANNVTVEAVGTGRAKRFLTLNPVTSGEIVEFAVRAGDRVKRGDIILRLDARQAELAVKVAKTKRVEAERLMARSEQLHGKSLISQAKVDDARNISQRSELELKQAEEALADRTLKAPFEGVVGIPKVEFGDRVTTDTEIITLDDRSALLIEFEVPELYLSRVSVGHEIVGHTPSFGQRKFVGKIDQIDSRVDRTSRSVMARAVLPNPYDRLRPGMSFAVEIILPGKTFPVVPELALLWGKGESYVWRINNGRAEKIGVRIVKRLNSAILVDGKISDGDLVVVEGVQRLRHGRAVMLLSQPPQRSGLSSRLETKND